MPESLNLTPRRLAAALLFVALFVLATRPLADTDLWWHLATGRLIVAEGRVPLADPFSFTRYGTHWVAHEWLSDVVLFLLYQGGAESALVLLAAALVTLIFALVYRLCPAQPHLALPVTLLAAFCTMVVWGPRPQLFTLLCASITLTVLSSARKNRTESLWALPPLLLLWANLHGGFLLGLAILAATICGEALEILHTSRFGGAHSYGTLPLKMLLIVSVAGLLASLLNPNGAELLVYPFFTMTSKAMQTYITEWHSPDFQDVRFFPFASFLLLLIAALALSSRRPRFSELLVVLGLGYAALTSLRNIPLFVVAAAPMLASQLESACGSLGLQLPAERRHPRGTALINYLVLLCVGLALSLRVSAVLSDSTDLTKTFPVQVADYLATGGSPGPLLNSYNLGGFLIWRLHPNRPVFVDGRADVYGDAFMHEYYARIWLAKGDWRAYLDGFGIQTVVIERDASLVERLNTDPAWRLAMEDPVAVVFERRAQ